ncbi:carboxymuconolactone decarboxylase family protein [Halalkalibacter sp. APA_J-10(15)]|uniref:carboxymuconolactone decarboxylase family protein n=1 Tax=Halalkalibacter sp. APA_J-10(15) TaxID=2933805 RepID=UPI001FF120F4|nr:carboxymuconolactone decarboxylase family protein [Halalkalibacter sp. APA_J-10(15)]MCK0471078.1 carboxymuconolactone decarboxylase family protein [Halalkalibacter sp. APA_J-10(15)]
MSIRDESYEKGMDILRQIRGEQGIDQVQRFQSIHPAFEEMMMSFGYGEVWSRTELDHKQRALITLSSLVTQGIPEALRFHVHTAIHVGVTPKEILELVLHCAAYAGFPKSVAAFPVILEVFEEIGVEVDW